jgi:hypothetical protein
MKNQTSQMLPIEVAQIAESVSVEKRNEVQSVLNYVFNGVSKMREQLDTVSVKDENDKTNMKLANTIRLGVRQVRLDAEKTFDAKRAEVQAQMISYKTEDQLWLKAKQTMQILTKEIEEQARWKEETRQRFESEQRALKIQQRVARISAVSSDIPLSDFESMSDEGFEIFFEQLERIYVEKMEAARKAEEERIAKEKAEAEERERIKVENERLRAEAEAKKKELADQRAKAEAERIAFEEEARKAKEIADAKLKAERQEKERLEAELKAKAQAEIAARKEVEARAAAELKAQQDAEKKAKAAPDKTKLNELANLFENFSFPEVKSEEAQAILNDVKSLMLKVSNYIREKTQAI